MYIYLIMKLKIIKSLLIPTLGITLSATTISSLTSCTNNNEIKNYYLTGGSTLLKGIYQKDLQDNNQWKLSIGGADITSNINWGVSNLSDDELTNNIFVNNGVVSWSGNIHAGQYNFCITATYDGLKVKSPQIKLTISQYILDGGSVQLNGIQGKAESDTKSWQLSIDEKTIADNIVWGIEDNNGAAINGISINGGIVSWVANMNTGEYYFYVIATYDGIKIKSPQIKLTISQYILDGGNTELNGIHNHDGQDKFSWRLLFNGTTITNNFIWGLESDNNDTVNDNIHIIPSTILPYFANVSWSGNIAIGDYYFFVIATYNGLTIKLSLIHLVISE